MSNIEMIFENPTVSRGWIYQQMKLETKNCTDKFIEKEGAIMKVSKEEFVRNIIKGQATRKAKKEKETIAVIKESVYRCQRKSCKRHVKVEGQI